jgi:hypothetical protein
VSVAGDEATLIVIGFGELPPVTRLASDLQQATGRPLVVIVEDVQARKQTAGGQAVSP